MHCIRRAALRSAISAARQVTPKICVAPFAQAASRATAPQIPKLIQASRCFSQTAHSQNVEEQGQVEEVLSSQLEEQNASKEPAPRSDELKNGVFIRNLIFDATEKHLLAAFEKYGEVTEVSIARDARGLSRGYGFVYFKDPASAEEAIRSVDGTFWHGRRVGCSARTAGDRNPDGPRRHPAKAEPKAPTTTLYVGNIPYETTDAELNKLFRDLNNVVDIRVAVDRTTGWPRGFVHADFANIESAIKAFEILQGTKLGTRSLVVDYSETRQVGRR